MDIHANLIMPSTMTLDAIVQRNNSNYLNNLTQQQQQQQQHHSSFECDPKGKALSEGTDIAKYVASSTSRMLVPPPVGVQISAGPSTTSASAAASIATFHYDSSPCVKSDKPSSSYTGLGFDATIMHRVVPPTLLDVCVRIDAPTFLIASTFDLPVALVCNQWITTRTPCGLVPPERTNGYQNLVGSAPRLARHSSLDGRRTGPATSLDTDEPGPVLRRRLSVGGVSQSELTAYAHLAVELRRKLTSIAKERAEIETRHYPDRRSHHPLPSVSPSLALDAANVHVVPCVKDTEKYPIDSESRNTSHRVGEPLPCHTNKANDSIVMNDDNVHNVEDDDATKASIGEKQRRALASARCGFATKHTHADLTLSHNRSSVMKRKKGLYRAAMSASTIATDRVGTQYVEVEVVKACGEGGLCIGLLSRDAPLNRVVGTGKDGVIGVGLHSAGKLVVADVWRDVVCHPSRVGKGEQACGFGSGDVIGVRVDTRVVNAGSPFSSAEDVDPDSSVSSSDEATLAVNSAREDREREESGADAVRVSVSFFVNGSLVASSELDMPKPIPLALAVSLYRDGSQVALCCCSSSWRFLPTSSSSSSACQTNTSRMSSSSLRAMCDPPLPQLAPSCGAVSKLPKSLGCDSSSTIPTANSNRAVLGVLAREQHSSLNGGCASVLTP